MEEIGKGGGDEERWKRGDGRVRVRGERERWTAEVRAGKRNGDGRREEVEEMGISGGDGKNGRNEERKRRWIRIMERWKRED